VTLSFFFSRQKYLLKREIRRRGKWAGRAISYLSTTSSGTEDWPSLDRPSLSDMLAPENLRASNSPYILRPLYEFSRIGKAEDREATSPLVNNTRVTHSKSKVYAAGGVNVGNLKMANGTCKRLQYYHTVHTSAVCLPVKRNLSMATFEDLASAHEEKVRCVLGGCPPPATWRKACAE
jgi:hypothetical protein